MASEFLQMASEFLQMASEFLQMASEFLIALPANPLGTGVSRLSKTLIIIN
jgi:hypothetical protein